MIPRFSAIVTACVRSLAPSLARMFEMWLLTVSSAIDSRPAISLFAFPAAISRSTSISRYERASSEAWSTNSAATSGGMRFWPAWTARMVSSSSLRTCPFNM
jgi:hypothetical protein